MLAAAACHSSAAALAPSACTGTPPSRVCLRRNASSRQGAGLGAGVQVAADALGASRLQCQVRGLCSLVSVYVPSGEESQGAAGTAEAARTQGTARSARSCSGGRLLGTAALQHTRAACGTGAPQRHPPRAPSCPPIPPLPHPPPPPRRMKPDQRSHITQRATGAGTRTHPARSRPAGRPCPASARCGSWRAAWPAA